MLYAVMLLLTVAVLAGAKEDIFVDETHQMETLGDLNDKTDNGYNENEPDEIKMSWQTVQQVLELIGELGNVTGMFYILDLSCSAYSISS